MKILNAVIIEDEELSMTILKSILKDLSYIKVVAAVDNMEDGEKEILFHKPQILFLDIRIHGEPIFNLLEKLGPRNLDFGVVFTTAYHDEYLKAAIENCGTKYKFVYLGKPIHSTNLITRVNTLRKEMMKATKEEEDLDSELVIHHKSGLTRLLCDEIFYCEVEGNDSLIHTTDEKVEVVNLNLTKLYEKLPPHLFYRMSGQYIINRDYLRKVFKSHNHYVCVLRIGDNQANLHLPLRQWKYLKEEFSGMEGV